ncbi:MAG: hypothetical protein ACC655_10605 [Rhodothermia bacterium]
MKSIASVPVSTVVCAAVLFLFSFPAAAQDDVDLGPPLTKARAESFVALLRDIIEIGKKYEGEDVPALLGDVTSGDFDGAIAAMSNHPAYREIVAAVEKRGFDRPEEWAQTSSRFFSAYSALKLEEEGTDISVEMKRAIGQIQKNTTLTDEQKEQMIEMMKAQQQAFEDFEGDASDSDKAAVKAVMEEFEKLNSDS